MSKNSIQQPETKSNQGDCTDLSPSPCYATKWCVRYETENGYCHPKWFESIEPITKKDIIPEAIKALEAEDWLMEIESIYPVPGTIKHNVRGERPERSKSKL